jgi:diguanylate cyclase (GGDEF)-like protein
MSIIEEIKTYKSYIISISLAIALCLSAVFLGIAINTRHLVSEEILTRGKAHFNNIVITRKWNAKYGGVYVEKKEGVESNPYLDDPDITTVYNKTYTLKNPALMTREISEFAEKEGLFQFHITSLDPVNPANKADKFEETALRSFEKGVKETHRKEIKDNKTYFRYMAPLYVEKECLKCHAKQGYKIGDVRGGISVTFNIDSIQNKLHTNIIIISILGVVTIVSLLGLVYLLTMILIKKLKEARNKIETLAITDELTGLFNRRHLITRLDEEIKRSRRLEKKLGCILIDIDHFKSINDNYGHLFGDEALRSISSLIQKSIRSYDILGRIGGEEFLVILPDTNFEETRNFAERIRTDIKDNFELKTESSGAIKITVSLGISEMQYSDPSIDDIIQRADRGLYKAKNSGRDRVGWI